MELIIQKTGEQIKYDSKYVYIHNVKRTLYLQSAAMWLDNRELITTFNTKGSTVYTKTTFDKSIKVYSLSHSKKILDSKTQEVVATYSGSTEGAIVAYVTYCYAKAQGIIQDEKETNHYKLENQIPKFERIEKNEKKEYNEYEKKETKEPIKKDYDVPQINVPIPGVAGGNNSSEDSGAGCLGVAILGIIGVVAISLIPQSWKDLTHFIPEGDLGIIISFFSAVIGGILGIIVSLRSKTSSFTNGMGTFLGTCGLGVGICAIMLLQEITSGTSKFTGFILFDIPLCIFAPLLGSFQFAFPIGIGVAIICGIIHFVKSQN